MARNGVGLVLAGFVVAGMATGASAQEPTPSERVQDAFSALDNSSDVLTSPGPVARDGQLGVPGVDPSSPEARQELYSVPEPGSPVTSFQQQAPSYKEGDVIPRDQPLGDWGAQPPHPQGLPLDPTPGATPKDQAPPGWELDEGEPMQQQPPATFRDAMDGLENPGFQAEYAGIGDYGLDADIGGFVSAGYAGYTGEYGTPDDDVAADPSADTDYDSAAHDATGIDADDTAGPDGDHENGGYEASDSGDGDSGSDDSYDGPVSDDSGYDDSGYDDSGYDSGGYDGGGYDSGGYDSGGYI